MKDSNTPPVFYLEGGKGTTHYSKSKSDNFSFIQFILNLANIPKIDTMTQEKHHH